jgi:hypothetical protein
MFTSLLSLGTVIAAISGIARIRNGTFQSFLQNIMNSFTGSAAQKVPQAVQGMMNGQAGQNDPATPRYDKRTGMTKHDAFIIEYRNPFFN